MKRQEGMNLESNTDNYVKAIIGGSKRGMCMHMFLRL